MGKICDMDCFNCKFPDCINDTVYPESARYCNWSEERKKRDNARCAKRYREAVSKGLCGRCHKNRSTKANYVMNAGSSEKDMTLQKLHISGNTGANTVYVIFAIRLLSLERKPAKSICASSKKKWHTPHNLTT